MEALFIQSQAVGDELDSGTRLSCPGGPREEGYRPLEDPTPQHAVESFYAGGQSLSVAYVGNLDGRSLEQDDTLFGYDVVDFVI